MNNVENEKVWGEKEKTLSIIGLRDFSVKEGKMCLRRRKRYCSRIK